MSRDLIALDNPIWNALTSWHAHFAEGDDLARRYPPAVTPLAAMQDGSSASYDALRAVLGPDGRAGLFAADRFEAPAPWSVLQRGVLAQMVHEGAAPNADTAGVLQLSTQDLSDMLALAAKTEPGPFGPRTPELGTYVGIRDGTRLAAMAGERLRLGPFVEISAVCTDPDHQGRGLATRLVAFLVALARQRGEIPFLHVRPDNGAALRVYERTGFVTRCRVHLVVLQAPSGS